MGSAQDDPDRQQVEGPSRRVVITRPFAIGKFEITVDEFTAFVAATATTMNSPFNKCAVTLSVDVEPPTWMQSENASFRRPGFDVTGAHPAGCVSWYDAQAYVAWLRRRTGKPYRLPTEVEWEYAARAGTTTKFNFGDDERLLCDYARFADLTSHYAWRDSCRSGLTNDGPIQVGKLKPNAWGIFDMHGNVWEWVEDCWTPNWTEIPTDGSAYARPGNCEMGVIRGGSWNSPSRRLRTAFRNKTLHAGAGSKHWLPRGSHAWCAMMHKVALLELLTTINTSALGHLSLDRDCLGTVKVTPLSDEPSTWTAR